ncbi:hypothetical protein DB346_12800 [Verrucomicrobia bacterium LW23]|nr:hypothetical protein DB346_12800 [Verrucomicrobia bacterium LW23]
MLKSVINRIPFKSLLLCGLLLPAATALQAADLYILPSGAGSKDGTSWENAKAGTRADFQAAWDALTPGDTLFVGSGTYDDAPGIKAEKGGAEGKPLRLVGVDRGTGLPLLTSNFDKNKPDKTGAGFFDAPLGVSNFEIEGFRLKNYRIGVYMRGRNSNIRISKLDIQEAREGIRSEGGGTIQNPAAASNNVHVSDCRFVKFTKRGIRLQGGNYNWKIERCHADAGGKEWFTEPFHMGFQVANKSLKDSPFEHHIEFYDCVALNSYHEPAEGKAYWNADGFCAEAKVTHLRYVRCVAMHNTDGGWDDKSDGPEFIDCVSIDNKENFRLWGRNIPAKMKNVLSAYAHKRGGSGPETGLWLLGSLEAENCTFLGNSTQITADAEKASPDAKLVFRNCLFAGGKLGAAAKAQMENSVVSDPDGKTVDVGIAAPKGTLWNNITPDFNSTTYPDKGFSSTRWSK